MLGVIAFRSAPSDVDEFNKLAGSDCVLDYADAEAYYRGIAPKVRSKFLEAVVAATGVSMIVIATKPTPTKDNPEKTTNVMEKDTSYIKRVKASGVADEVLVPLLQAAYDEVGYDLSSSRNTGASQRDFESADYYINAVASGESNWDRIVGNFEKTIPGLSIAREEDGTVTREIMAEACKAFRLHQASIKLA